VPSYYLDPDDGGNIGLRGRSTLTTGFPVSWECYLG
jgi:hypothetical protein